jgi:hypothetical protein
VTQEQATKIAEEYAAAEKLGSLTNVVFSDAEEMNAIYKLAGLEQKARNHWSCRFEYELPPGALVASGLDVYVLVDDETGEVSILRGL